jgi:hypothetical protein
MASSYMQTRRQINEKVLGKERIDCSSFVVGFIFSADGATQAKSSRPTSRTGGYAGTE